MNFSHQFFLILLLNVLLINSETTKDESTTKHRSALDSAQTSTESISPSNKPLDDTTKESKTTSSPPGSSRSSSSEESGSTERPTTKAVSSATEPVPSAAVIRVKGLTTASELSSTESPPSAANQAAAPPAPFPAFRRRFDSKQNVHFDPISKAPYDSKMRPEKGSISKNFDRISLNLNKINLEKGNIDPNPNTISLPKTSLTRHLYDSHKSQLSATTIDPEECDNKTSTTTSAPIAIEHFDDDFGHPSQLAENVEPIAEQTAKPIVDSTPEPIAEPIEKESPIRPSDSEPLRPSDSEPLRPSDSEPLRPSDSEPLRPSDSEPLRPSDSEPLRPSDSEPLRPSESQPLSPEPIKNLKNDGNEIHTEPTVETTVRPVIDPRVTESEGLNDSSIDDLLHDKLFDIKGDEKKEDENTTTVPKIPHESVDSEDSCEPQNIKALVKTLKVLSKNAEYQKVVDRFSHDIENMTFLNDIVIGNNEENSHEIHPIAIVSIDESHDHKDLKRLIGAKNSGKSDHRLVDTDSDDETPDVIVIEEHKDDHDHDHPIIIQQDTHFKAPEPIRKQVSYVQPPPYRVNPSYGSVRYPQLVKQRQTTILTPAYRSTSYQVVNRPPVQYRPYYPPAVQYPQNRVYPKTPYTRPVTLPNIRQWKPIPRQNAFNNNVNGINKALASLPPPQRLPNQQNFVQNKGPVTQLNAVRPQYRPQFSRGPVIGQQNTVQYNPNARPIQNVNSNPTPIVNRPPIQRQIQSRPSYVRPIPNPRIGLPQAPVAQAPIVQAPVIQAPVAQAPVVQAPVAQVPFVQAPVQAPVVQAPIAQPPVIKTPVNEQPAPVIQRQVYQPNRRQIIPNPRPVLGQSQPPNQLYQRRTLSQPQSQPQRQTQTPVQNRFSSVYSRSSSSKDSSKESSSSSHSSSSLSIGEHK